MIEGINIKLRAYRKEDIPVLHEMLNDRETKENAHSTIIYPFRLDEQEKWISSFSGNSSGVYEFAIELINEKEYIGTCGLHEVDQKNRIGELGVTLRKEFWGNGYGTEAIKLLIDFCFDEVNLNKIKLEVFEFNKRAIASYKKLGFKQEGCLREEIYRYARYNDVIIMGMLKSEWEKSKS